MRVLTNAKSTGQRRPTAICYRVPYVGHLTRPCDEAAIRRPRKINVKPNAKEKTNMKDQNYAATKTREIVWPSARPSIGESRLITATQHLRPRNASTSERDHHGN